MWYYLILQFCYCDDNGNCNNGYSYDNDGDKREEDDTNKMIKKW